MKKFAYIIGLICFPFLTVLGQDETLYLSEIQEIDDLLEDASEYYEDVDKLEANSQVISILSEIFEQPDAEKAAWDSLKRISVLTSPDKKLRILTWNIMFDDLTHKCFGFIQYIPEKDESYVYQLKDFYTEIDSVNRKFASYAEWYGAIYYDIIERPLNKKENVYTLLGWRGQNALSQQKVVETLEFDSHNLPVFGNRRFRVDRSREQRIIFTYSVKTQMILRFNKKQDFIVADHLAPSNPKLAGHYEYYGPDYSYDAFEYKEGKWYFVSDIDPEVAINFEKNSEMERFRDRKPSQNF